MVFFCFLLVAGAAQAENGLVRITDKVYAYVDVKESSAANSFGANAGIIIGDKEIIVIDTLVSAREAQRFIRDIREISEKPIKYVVNTHYHLDHSFGNSEFIKLGATLITHANCADEIRLKGQSTLAGAEGYGLTPEDMVGTEISFPEITFTDRMQLTLDGMDIQLIYVAPSHSKGSILVYLPGEKVVFAGDVLFTDFHPYMGDGDIAGWLQNLDFLAGLEADRIIPGHGPLSNKKDVADMQAYITTFDRKAGELASDTRGLAEIIAEMKKILPARAQGEWLIGASLQAKYLKPIDNGKN